MSNKAYNITVIPTVTATKGKTSTGTEKITFRAKATIRGRQVERTVVAMGKAAEAIRGKVRKNSEIALRVLFERAPANDEGRGGEFLSVVGLPTPKAAA